MFEYGAPLIWAWKSQVGDKSKVWKTAETLWRDLVAWIAGGAYAPRVTANLLGLLPLSDRYEALHASFAFAFDRVETTTPLKRQVVACCRKGSFLWNLGHSDLFVSWKKAACSDTDYKCRRSLGRFLLRWRFDKLQAEAQNGHLTRLIPLSTRLQTGCRGADAVLGLDPKKQQVLLHYRRNAWSTGKRHGCFEGVTTFRRGHERCECFGRQYGLSEAQEKAKKELDERFEGEQFTDIDFLLNAGEFDQAFHRLGVIGLQLGETYHEQCMEGS
jgi:hypothetical protein